MSSRTRTMMTSKIHRATVTQADLDYVGSITAVSYTHLTLPTTPYV